MNSYLKNRLKRLPLFLLNPVRYEHLRYWFAHKALLNLECPVTFNQKLCHRKLFDRNPLYVDIADKIAARAYVKEIAGSSILTECYFAGHPDDLDYEGLPDQFVAKANNASGFEYLLIVNNKIELDRNQFLFSMHKFINNDYGRTTNEWWYQQITPKIIIEEYLQDKIYSVPLDFKIYVFHGKVELLHVNYIKNGEKNRVFYTPTWEKLNIRKKDISIGEPLPPPQDLRSILDIAERLGRDFDFIRVDLYNIDDTQIVFSELTLAPGAGFSPFYPRYWDEQLGGLWHYPK